MLNLIVSESHLNDFMFDRVFSPSDILDILSASFSIPIINIFISGYSNSNIFNYTSNYLYVEIMEYPPDFPLTLTISAVNKSHDGIKIPSPNNMDIIRRMSAISNSRVLMTAPYPISDASSIYVNWIILPSGQVYRVKMDVDAMNEEPSRASIDMSIEPTLIEI